MSEQRVIRKTVIQAQIEATYGTQVSIFAATDCILIKEASFNIDRDVVPRGLIRPWLGASKDLIGTRRMIAKFKVELAGAGTADGVPEWGTLLRMCGFTQTVFAASRVEYTPISDAMESATMRYFIDGVAYISRGARGTGKINLNAYGIPELEMEVWGFDTACGEITMPVANFSAWQEPMVITDANSADIKLGGTFSAGALTGGTAYTSKGLTVDLGGTLSHQKLLGAESIIVSDRTIMGNCTLAMDGATEVTWRNEINANTSSSMSFRIGATAGKKIAIFGANVQRTNPQASDNNGVHMITTDLKFIPTAAGNDIKIVSL